MRLEDRQATKAYILKKDKERKERLKHIDDPAEAENDFVPDMKDYSRVIQNSLDRLK